MPKFLIPHKSHSHRVAAIALYRALISQCKKLHLPGNANPELHNLIGNRFRDFRHTTSQKALKVVFNAGYEAVDHLDAAVAGAQTSVDYILELLERAPRKAKVSRFGKRQSPQPNRTAEAGTLPTGDGDTDVSGVATDNTAAVVPPAGQADQSIVHVDGKHGSSLENCVQHVELLQPLVRTYTVHDDGPKHLQSTLTDPTIKKHIATSEVNVRRVLARPRPQSELGGTGTRKIPYLFSAQNIPVLRFKKPQPQALSGYINSRLQQRQRRHTLKNELEHLNAVAQSEDSWDSIMYEHTGVDSRHATKNGKGVSETNWKQETSRALSVVQESLAREREKNKRMAEQMLDIVIREAALAKREAKLAEKEAAVESLTESDLPKEVLSERRQDWNDQRKLASFVEDIVNAESVKAETTAKGSYQSLGRAQYEWP